MEDIEDPQPAEHRLRQFFAEGWTLGGLVTFHTCHKLELFSHDVAGYRLLGRLVGEASLIAKHTLRRRYRETFLTVLAVPPTRARHVDTLSHAVGHLRKRIDQPTRRRIRALIEAYRLTEGDLDAARAELRCCAYENAITYLRQQTYLADGMPTERSS